MAISFSPEARIMIEKLGYKTTDFSNGLSKEQYQRLSGQNAGQSHPQGVLQGQKVLDMMRSYQMNGGNGEQAVTMAKAVNGSHQAMRSLKGNGYDGRGVGGDDGENVSWDAHERTEAAKANARQNVADTIKQEQANAKAQGKILKHVNGKSVLVDGAGNDTSAPIKTHGGGMAAPFNPVNSPTQTTSEQ